MENAKINGGYPLHTFEDIEELYKVYITIEEDRKLIKDAYEFVKEKHKNQYRKSGEPYIHHLLEVCYILATLQAGPKTLASGLLHDVMEDCDVSLKEMKEKFGDEVAMIVNALTKIQRMKLSHRKMTDFDAEDHRKIFLGMAKDIRVIIIKLADRLHNMRTLDSLSRERQIALSTETLEVFTPIAHRLGINTIKSELEDLCLKYLDKEKYDEAKKYLESKIKNKEKSLDLLMKRIADILFNNNIQFEMKSRIKSVYSIYKKVYLKHHSYDDIYDVLAIRIITKTELNCYEILGLIHATYKPIPGRFKDYIAMPKPNMYQSLHTCIISGDGSIFEIQIRTEEMDEVAETGVAAHWRYKEGTNYNPKQEQKEIEEKLHWFRDFVELTKVSKDTNAKEYMDNLTHDIFEANVYVFTPLGKVIELPNGSTPLDFAYRIHTKVGDSAVGAIVNGNLVPLGTPLKTGDVVEIKTSKTSLGPNDGWLELVKTAQAKQHIRKFLAKKNLSLNKDEHILEAKQNLLESLKDRETEGVNIFEEIESSKCLNYFNVENVDELYLKLFNKNITYAQIIDYLGLKRRKEELKLHKKNIDNGCPVEVGSVDGIAVNLGSCCTPIPGDEIVGYITKGKGITIHRIDCPNIVGEDKRLISVNWKKNLVEQTYPIDIKIECNDRKNLLVDIMGCFSQHKTPVTSISAKYHQNTNTTTISATILVKNKTEFIDISNVILNVESVYDIQRVTH